MDKTITDASQKIVESSQLREASKTLEKLLKQGEEAGWKIGACYNRIIDQKLAEKSGYRHACDFFASRFPRVSQATLTHYGAVARAFSASAGLSVSYLPSRFSCLMGADEPRTGARGGAAGQALPAAAL